MPNDHAWGTFFMRWLHVLSGVMWIGILWYFNFVQIPSMPSIPDDQKPAISKVIAPAALFWFRWAAMATIATGLILAWMNNYFIESLTLGLMDGVAKQTTSMPIISTSTAGFLPLGFTTNSRTILKM